MFYLLNLIHGFVAQLVRVLGDPTCNPQVVSLILTGVEDFFTLILVISYFLSSTCSPEGSVRVSPSSELIGPQYVHVSTQIRLRTLIYLFSLF